MAKSGSGAGKKIDASKFNMDLSGPLDGIEKGIIRSAVGVLILFIVYCTFSTLLNNQIINKTEETEKSIQDTSLQIDMASKDIKKIQDITNEYQTKINNLQANRNKYTENNRTKKSIPILLNRLMYIMPEGVQITSIENTTDTHIVINAQSREYAQLGYLTATIDTKMFLTNVISTSGQKENNLISIKIEGDLP